MPKAPRSRTGVSLRRAAEASALARATGAPIDEASEMVEERAACEAARMDRRTMLKGAGALTGIAGLGPIASLRRRTTVRAARSTPKVVIVGGGLAGLTCAQVLWTKYRLRSTVYEWDDSPGGRVSTYRDVFANGQIVEEHGEFISSEHHRMLSLVSRYGLSLDNTGYYPAGTKDGYWFSGRPYTQAMLNADWHEFGWSLFHRAALSASWPTTYTQYNADGLALDRQSVSEWIEANVPGGSSSAFGKLCYYDVESEYGGPADRQSALNLIYLLAYDDSLRGAGWQPKGAPILAGTNEKWHVHDGNDQIITGLLGELPEGTVRTGQQLVALRDNGSLTYTCTFDSGGTLTDVNANHVVLAIPFTKLREVALTHASFSPLKMTAINELQLGNNVKLGLQVLGNPWNAHGSTGNLLTDDGANGGWDITSYQPAPTSIFLDFPSGTTGANLSSAYGLVDDNGVAPPAMVNNYLAYLEPIYPGMTAAWKEGPRIAWYADGNIDIHIGGAWSQYNVGQYTRFGGIEGMSEGNVHFAGEHTSLQYQGFMEGAVQSGQRVAREI